MKFVKSGSTGQKLFGIEMLLRCCRHFDVSTTGQLEEVKEGLGLAFLEKMVSRDQLWITATVSPLLLPALSCATLK